MLFFKILSPICVLKGYKRKGKLYKFGSMYDGVYFVDQSSEENRN